MEALEERMRRRAEVREQQRSAQGGAPKLSDEVEAFDREFHGELKRGLEGAAEAGDVEAAVLAYRSMLSLLELSVKMLPQWDRQRANEALAEGLRLINGVKSSSKKRFKFSREARPVLPGLEAERQAVAAAAEAAAADNAGAAGAADGENSARVMDRTNETLHLSPKGSIFLMRLKNCRVFILPVDGSVFVQECEGCTIVAAARQFRIHDTRETSFYLHCASEPIIESCSAVGFAPFNWTFDRKEETIAATSLGSLPNLWDKVNDFKWLRSQHSPNWYLIPAKAQRHFRGDAGEEVEAAAEEAD